MELGLELVEPLQDELHKVQSTPMVEEKKDKKVRDAFKI